MDIDIDRLPQDTNAAVELLRRAAHAIRGRPLRRQSWAMIVEALRSPRLRPLFAQRLSSARNREDLLRILRIARKRRVRKSAKKGGGRRIRPSVTDGGREVFLGGEEVWWRYDEDDDYGPYVEGLQQRDQTPLLSTLHELRMPGVLTASRIEEQASVLRRRDVRLLGDDPPRTLRSLIGRAAFDRLCERVGHRPEEGAGKHRWPEVIANFEEFVQASLQFPQKPSASTSIPWEEILREVLVHMRRPVADAGRVLTGALVALTHAPPEELSLLLPAIQEIHRGWVPALWPLVELARTREPGQHPSGVEPPVPSAVVLGEVGFGSRLVHHLLLRGLRDRSHLHGTEMRFKSYLGLPERARDLVVHAAGSFRRLDYPAFRVVARASLRTFSSDTIAKLRAVEADLRSLAASLSREGAAAFDWLRAAECSLASAAGEGTPASVTTSLLEILARDSLAHAELRAGRFAQCPERIRVRHVRKYWQSSGPEALELLHGEGGRGIAGVHRHLVERHGPVRAAESLAHALLGLVVGPWPDERFGAPEIREAATQALRDLTLSLGWPDELPGDEQDRMRALVQRLYERTGQGPAEMMATLRGPGAGEMPRLRGGHLSPRERHLRDFLREVLGSASGSLESEHPRSFECRPLSKTEALLRGELAGDCSSGSVPLRALCPHHTYYGVWENGESHRGYMTVYEAWAHRDDGVTEPVLCLETINVRLPCFDAIQADLLTIFEAIASSRGLSPHLVVSADRGTWNFPNREVICTLPRFRRGQPVRLSPADPVQWRAYQALEPQDARAYCAFEKAHDRLHGLIRQLAPRVSAHEPIQPENEAEAIRLHELPRGPLIATVRTESGIEGFISELPEAF